MRLIEFLSPKPVTDLATSGLRYVRLPMWVLEGSYADYRKFAAQKLIESFGLTEAAKDRYVTMINVFNQIDAVAKENNLGFTTFPAMMDQLNWAMQVLRREDRIVWFMRLKKIHELNILAHTPIADGPRHTELVDMINKEYRKAVGKLQKIYGSEQAVLAVVESINNHAFSTQIEHFLSMGIPSIDATQWGNQTANELFQHFRAIETEWTNQRASVINMDDDDERDGVTIVEQFPDGSAWFNLGRSSCRIEGEAMGHCGNTAANRSTETVLSYRVPVDSNGKPRSGKGQDGNFWRPSLTFILNKETGLLGEMKGRANNKPAEKYHPYIIALLRNDMVKGITGGGYAPEENFALEDLDTDVMEALLEEKPSLGSLSRQYKTSGKTPELLERVMSAIDAAGIQQFGWTNNQSGLRVDYFKTVFSFVEEYCESNGVAANIADMINGNGDIHDWDADTGDLSSRQELADAVFRKEPKMWKQLQAYVRSEYPDQVEPVEDDSDPDYDIDDVDDVIRLLEDERDDIYDQLGWAIAEGHRAGSESEMYDAFWSWLSDGVFDADGFVLEYNKDTRYDSEAYLVIEFPALMEFMDDPDDFEYQVNNNGWRELADVKSMDEPYYGWDGYDEATAMDRFREDVTIPSVPSYEIEHEGNAKGIDARKLEKKLVDDGAKEVHWGGVGKVYTTSVESRMSNIDEVHGVVALDVYSKDEQQFGNDLRYLKAFADETQVPIVIRKYNDHHLTDRVGEAGFEKVRHDYLRYDPSTNEATRIKLRGFDARKDDGDPDEFMAELADLTDPHPFNDRTVLYGSIGIEVSKWGSQIHLGDIVSLGDKGAGHGTQALQMLMALADKHGVVISGTAKAYSTVAGHIQSTKRLAQWYKKHGFIITGGFAEDGFDIEYHPKGHA